MTPQQIIHATFRAGRKLALLVFALLLLVALLDLFGIAPAFLMPLTAHIGTWLALCAFVAALFWGVAFAIDPYRTGPVPVDALFAKAQRKLNASSPSRADTLLRCVDALSTLSDTGLRKPFLSLARNAPARRSTCSMKPTWKRRISPLRRR